MAQEVSPKAQFFFSKKYPRATEVKWIKGEDMYEVGFKSSGRKMTAQFDKKGTWLETRSNTTESRLPEIVLEVYTKKYPNGFLESAERIDSPVGTKFLILIDNNGRMQRLTISQSGGVFSNKPVSDSEEEPDIF